MWRNASMNRKLWIVVCCGAAAAVGLTLGLPAWRSRQLERRVAGTVEKLELRDPPAIEPDLIAALEGNARYAGELRLFGGVQLLRAGEPVLALELAGVWRRAAAQLRSGAAAGPVR